MISLRRLALNCQCLAAATVLAVAPILSAAEAALVASPADGWPQFRGPRRDGISAERGLLPTWPEAGPPVKWTATGAGRGFSQPIIAGGRLYLTGDFDADLQILAFDLEGKPLWRTKNGSAWLNQYPGARASVTFFDGRVYHENAHGRLACLEAATGRELWSTELLERFRGENITWGLSECVLVDERAVYATPGGRDALMVAFDRLTGAVVWKTAPLPKAEAKGDVDQAGYSPPIFVQFGGRRLIVGCSSSQMFCVDAKTGEVQWVRARPTSYSVLAMTPVLVGDAIFMAAPFGPPAALGRLVPPSTPQGKVGLEEIWTATLDTAHGGVVHVGGKLFGSYYPRRGGWAALDAATGRVLYDAPDLVKGSVTWADGRLYVLSEDGWMRLLEPTESRFEIRGAFRLANARSDAWAHPVILNDRMYLRYHDTLTCYDVRAVVPRTAP